MRVKFWQMAMLVVWSMLAHAATAQLPPSRDRLDHPSHRYLPPPTGIRTVGEQVRALEQLSAANGAEGQSPFQLSPSQLKLLDSVVESFRNDKGELELPDPKSIPKPWIDSMLPDPKQRQQVKDVLEEYARTRNLQLAPSANSETPTPFDSPNPSAAGSKSSDPSSDRSTAPSPRSSNNAPRNNTSRSNPGDQAFKGVEANADQSRTSKDGSGESVSGESVSDSASPNRLAELQKLYESLKKIQEQRAQQEQQSDTSSRWSRRSAPAADANRNPNGTPRNDPRRTKPSGSSLSGPSAPSNNQRDRTDRMPRINQPRPNNPNNGQPGRFRPAPPLTDDDLANGLLNQAGAGDSVNGSPIDNASPKNADGSGDSASGSNLAAAPSADPKAPVLTPFDEGYDFSKDRQVLLDPFAQPEDATSEKGAGGNGARSGSGAQNAARPPRSTKPFDVRKLAQEPRMQPQGPAATPDESGFDLKRSIDQSGLGATLKRLVQKTLKEQGFDPSRPGGVLPSPNSTGGNSAGMVGQRPTSDSASGQGPSAITAEKLKQWANAVAASPNTSSNTSSTPTNSEWGNWMREVWKAVADAPARSSSGSSAASTGSIASGAAGSFGQLPEVRWTNSMTIAVLLVLGLGGFLIWLSRRRVAELASVTATQAEWARSVMAQGLKTRADVVRAFHQLVKQSRSVSDWWTHRSIVKHFSSQTPQLATAISELAIVYEQARYYPEDVELSQQQLAKVRTLLESVTIPSSKSS